MTKRLFIFTTLVSLLACKVLSQEAKQQVQIKPNFDQKLAEELNADHYGMKSYVLVILNTGSEDEKITDKSKRAELFKGHFANMGKLAKEGKLVLAGPLSGNKPKRGLFILNVETLAEAEELVKSDPTVKAGIFSYDLTQYYGSAALQKVNEIHETIQKVSM